MIVSRNKVLPTPLNGDVLSEPGPMPISHLDAVADQFKGSQDPPGETDANGNNIPDQVEAFVDTGSVDAENRGDMMESLAVPDLAFARHTELSLVSYGEAAYPISVYPNARVEHTEYAREWDGDLDGVPDPFDETPGSGAWGRIAEEPYGGKLDLSASDRDGDGIPDIHDPQPAAHDDSVLPRYHSSLLDLDGDGVPDTRDPHPLDPDSESDRGLDLSRPFDGGEPSSTPVLDLSDAPLPAPSKLDIPIGGGVKSAGLPVTSSEITRPAKQGQTGSRHGRGGKEQRASRGR